MRISDLAHKKILIAGYGKEGRSTERYIRTFVPGAHIHVTDQTDGPDYLDKQSDYDIVIKSPGIQKKAMTVPYTTAVNIFFENTKGMKIGVTGTKGKSTTTKLLYEMLLSAGKKVHLVGNIGRPWLDIPVHEHTADDMYVCELSSYQLDDIAFSPHISVFVSFFPEHMNYHGSVGEYLLAKSRILAHAGPDDYFVYNPKFQDLADLAKTSAAKAVPYTDTVPFSLDGGPLIGEHNRDNIRAAVTAAGLCGISPVHMERALFSFVPLPHRLENIGTYKGITFYDDAISTTPESTICAIDALKNISVLMLGGQDRGYDFTALTRMIHEKNIRNIVLFPDSGSKIEQLLTSYSTDAYRIFSTSDMRSAVQFAYTAADAGSICLLSTASPSYSVWRNFEEKGDLFQTYVKELGSNHI